MYLSYSKEFDFFPFMQRESYRKEGKKCISTFSYYNFYSRNIYYLPNHIMFNRNEITIHFRCHFPYTVVLKRLPCIIPKHVMPKWANMQVQ